MRTGQDILLIEMLRLPAALKHIPSHARFVRVSAWPCNSFLLTDSRTILTSHFRSTPPEHPRNWHEHGSYATEKQKCPFDREGRV